MIQPTEFSDWTGPLPHTDSAAGETLQKQGGVVLPTFCAYNQTRECFLSLEVKVFDAAAGYHSLTPADWAIGPSEGLWIQPFQAAPYDGFPLLLDLILLDARGVVLRVLDTSPASLTLWNGLPVASILVLPFNSVFATQTRGGDWVAICPCEEMQRRLKEIAEPELEVAGAVVLREKPLWSGGPGVLTLKERAGAGMLDPRQMHEMPLVNPETPAFSAPSNWLKKWWAPDPRIAPRVQMPGLAAYYWSGGAPQAHEIRNISLSGLYLVTEERWYPGTLVLLTLQHSGSGDEMNERTLFVYSRAVRWGEDGVGLQFVLSDPRMPALPGDKLNDGTTRKQLEKFLDGLRLK